uniref:FMR1 neighbor n=1 Tax=Rhinolophus ferrumequinum TaxID=59479 RepID=A0A671DLD4_RHIFE
MPLEDRLIIGRSRLTSCDIEMGLTDENPEVVSYSGGNSPKGQAMSQTPWQACRQPHHSLMKKWARKHFKMLLPTFCVVMLLCYYMNTGFLNSLSPGDYNQWSDENPSGKVLLNMLNSLSLILFPKACIPKEGQELKACDHGGDLKPSACWEGKCCYSSSSTNFSCFAPFKDKPAQRLRLFGFGVLSMISMGCLPIYLFVVCRNSTWANSLRRKIDKAFKDLKTRRNRQRRDTEMLGLEMEDEEDFIERKEAETKGNSQ